MSKDFGLEQYGPGKRMKDMIADKKYYLDTFKVTTGQLERIVAEGSKGGNFCDLFFESTAYTDILLRDGQVNSGGFHIDYGCGVRVLNQDKTGYAYSETTDAASLDAAVKAACAIGEGDTPIPHIYRGMPNPSADRYPINGDWRVEPVSEHIPFLRKLQSAIESRDKRAKKIVAMISSSVSDVLMFNSVREMKFDTRPMVSVSVSVVFEQGEGAQKKVENCSVSRSFRMGSEMLTASLINEIADEAVRGLDARFDARRPKGGRMSVVMGAGASGILLHEAMGHAFEADFNRKGQSVFSGRIGERICRKGINVVDDATIRYNRGSVNFDDEGVPGQRTMMVEDGILTSYLHDRISASYFGVTPTGNGRRESFRYSPLPRMRATYMEGGNDCTAEDIIASVKNGIFVDNFANGQVKIGEGDFTFYVKSGFLIENGRLTMPVKDINVIGNGPEALANITAVANDLKIDNGTWTCGKGQSVPVSCGIPTVLVEGLTVGGE